MAAGDRRGFRPEPQRRSDLGSRPPSLFDRHLTSKPETRDETRPGTTPFAVDDAP